MSVTTANLIMGPGTMYKGAFGAAEPFDVEINNTPAASAWTDVGGTMGGVNMSVNQTYTELAVDQIVDIPERRLTKREFIITTQLAEPILTNLSFALNISAPVTGATQDFLQPSAGTSATQPTYSAIIFDGFAAGSFRRRVFGRKMLSVGNVAFAYAKDSQSVFTVELSAHYVSAAITSFKVLDSKV